MKGRASTGRSTLRWVLPLPGEKLGDLPLALEQAAALLSESGMSAEECLRELDENVSALMQEGKSPD